MTSTIYWKECEKELPKDDSTVIIFSKAWKQQVDLGSLMDNGNFLTQFGLELDNMGDLFAPTHWAALPESPL